MTIEQDPAGVDIVLTPTGAKFRLPKALANAREDQLDAFVDLTKAAAHLEIVRKEVVWFVSKCREQHLSWDTIGVAVGTTGEGARRKYAASVRRSGLGEDR